MSAVVNSGNADPPIRDRGGGVITRRALLERLREPRRVALICAPAGSGKTVLLRSWLGEVAVTASVAWVPVGRDEADAQRFWLSVLDAIRDTCAAAALVRALSAAPGLDGWAIVERLLEDLESLDRPLWLVLDDLHELRSGVALRQLELLLTRAPAQLHFILSTRHDLQLGLHRLRLEGGLTEIRLAELRFTPDETRALFDAADVQVSDAVLRELHERTEGWAAGLTLAMLSLAGHPDPDRFAAEFSGNERTVAEYLLAEVLDRQPEEVRRLLLRTSVVERVTGPLADALTGGSDGARILHALEQANAFVVSLDGARRWFRCHRLFADLLALQLRRTEPGQIPALHAAAADWHAEHGYPVEAIRHAQAAEDWSLARRLLCDHWTGLRLDGHNATSHKLLSAFPSSVVRGDPELLSVVAADELTSGSLEEAERCLEQAATGSASVPAERRERFDLRLTIRRLRIARQRGNLPAVIEGAQKLLAPAQAPDAAVRGLDKELRALALIELGIAELWSARLEQIDSHLEQGIALARQAKRPYVEIGGLSAAALVAAISSYALAMKRSMAAIELAERHGWSEEPIVAIAYLTLGTVNVWQGRLNEAETWLDRSECALRDESEPAARMMIQQNRGLLEMARGRHRDALDAYAAAERYGQLLVKLHPIVTKMRAHWVCALVGAGRLERAGQVLAELEEAERDTGEIRTSIAAMRLALGEPEAAIDAVAPVIDGSFEVHTRHVWMVQAYLLDALARDALGDHAAAGRALERALDFAEPDGVLLPFLLHPAPALLGRHQRQRTAHAALISDVLIALDGTEPTSVRGEVQPLLEPLSESETRVLRYLPTNLSLREVGNELYVSVHTVRTHIKHIYGKLGVHSRGEAVARARALGLLAPSLRRP